MAFGGPSPVERAFNSLFYASLGLSLANVTLGLLCLQWIRGMKYEPPGLSSNAYSNFRYGRYLGFERWGAKGMVATLPLLLLAALLAFFAGLLAFASESDWIASIPLYIILPSVVAIVLFTTFVPGLVIIINMAFRKGSQFPSVPPFRSLQSWIAMQGFIQIFQAINRVFKLNPLPAFLSFQKCLNWGQLDLLWTGWSISYTEDIFLFPLILSTGTIEDMNTISNIFEGGSRINVQPKFRKLRILRKLASYGERLPATTRGSIVGLLFDEMAGLINVGVPLDAISGVFKVEEKIALAFTPEGKVSAVMMLGATLISHLDSMLQLINSLCFLCRTTNTSFESFWNLFWRALADVILGVSYSSDIDTAPSLFNDSLASMQTALENPVTDTRMVFQRGFKTFIKGLAYEVDHPSSWSRTERGSATLSAIALHPIWVPAREVIAALPPGEHTATAQKCMRTLDRIQRKFPSRPAPMESGDPLPKQLAPEGEDAQPTAQSPSHIAIDIEPKNDEEYAPTPAASLWQVSVDAVPDDDEHKGGTEDQITFKEHPATTAISTPFSLPTPPVDSPTSPPPLGV